MLVETLKKMKKTKKTKFEIKIKWILLIIMLNLYNVKTSKVIRKNDKKPNKKRKIKIDA